MGNSLHYYRQIAAAAAARDASPEGVARLDRLRKRQLAQFRALGRPPQRSARGAGEGIFG